MTEEKLNQAKELAKRIDGLKGHAKYVKTDYEDPYEGNQAYLYVEPSRGGYDKRKLDPEFLPFTIPEFVELYLNKIEKEIKKLEKEFEKL